jgi:hypothetical protein
MARTVLTLEQMQEKLMLMPFISLVPLSPRTKKSWYALFRKALRESRKSEYNPWVFQNGKDWESYNYVSLLKQTRAKNRPLMRVDPYPEVKAYQWHWKHHCDLLKKGARKPTGYVQEY